MDADGKLKFVGKGENIQTAIDKWIEEVSNKYSVKQSTSPAYHAENMPDMDSLMQEWPAEFEQLLSSTELPSATDDISLNEYADLICSLLDIPVYQSRINSLHILFLLYSEFKNSQHFKAMSNQRAYEQSAALQDTKKTDTLIL
ncbi:hypothetical protein D918_01661 [Trichuris suis]|nr:hypothetical protein D918_01661 [Trichuris suis]